MISATLALLGCVGGDWMILGGVALSERRAERRDWVMAMFEDCDILAIDASESYVERETREVVRAQVAWV